jgi:hypothetical protein
MNNSYISHETCLCKQNSKYVSKRNNVGKGSVKGAWNIPNNDIVAKLANYTPHFDNDESKESSCLESFPKLKPLTLILRLGLILERCDYLLHNFIFFKRSA